MSRIASPAPAPVPAGGPPRDRSTRKVGSPYRIVAIPAALALGSVGAIAAEHAQLPWIVGALAGALAAVLGVLALPSIPTRRATVVLLGLGGLAALRHSSFAGADRSWLLVLWAAATMLTLVLVDRADAETVPQLAGGTPLPRRLPETARVGAIIGVVVAIAAVALVPTVTERLGRRVWPGLQPGNADMFGAPSSLRSSNDLSLTNRPRLTDSVVFTVDAAHADFWRGETFDTYYPSGPTGSSWSNTDPGDPHLFLPHVDGTRVEVDPAPFDVGARTGTEFKQTFHVSAGYSDVVFAAPSPRVVETDKLLNERSDGTIRVAPESGPGFGKGAVYTVISRSIPVTEDKLRAASAAPVPNEIARTYAQPPATSERVADLARSIAAGETTTFDKVRAFESWLGANTQYSLDAPLSGRDVDVVDDFLFHTRLGWCEQIASSLVVMARSAGISARLVTGFAPGARDALTGRFVVRERDAHAWAEIYFPGIGWQGFDPTASVPLAGEAKPGGSWLTDARRNAVPLAIAGVLIVLIVLAAPQFIAASRRRRARKASWSASALHRLERAGRKAGRVRVPAETPREYAVALARRMDDERLVAVGDALDAALYSAKGVSESDRTHADAVLTSLTP